MSDYDEENGITEAERKAARELSESFAADSRKIGKDQLRKITQAGMTILAMAGNRFVAGFGKKGVEDIRNGNIVPYSADVVQWRCVCAADRETLRRWMSQPDSFRNHWQDLMLDSPVSMQDISQMFYDVFEAYQEIINSQVEAKPEKSTRAKSAPSKKKARSRAKPRNTPSR
jgi:hypothetical protein